LADIQDVADLAAGGRRDRRGGAGAVVLLAAEQHDEQRPNQREGECSGGEREPLAQMAGARLLAGHERTPPSVRGPEGAPPSRRGGDEGWTDDVLVGCASKRLNGVAARCGTGGA